MSLKKHKQTTATTTKPFVIKFEFGIVLTVRHHVQKTGKLRSLKKFGYTQDNALLFRPNFCPLLVHLWLHWLFHMNTPFPWCKILYIDTEGNCLVCIVFVVYLYFFASWIVFCFCFTHLIHWTVLEYAPTPHSAPRDLQKQDRVITRFSCYSTKKNSRHRTKFCQILSTHHFLVICLWCCTDRLGTILPTYIWSLFHKKL